jgi:hypothetical protein
MIDFMMANKQELYNIDYIERNIQIPNQTLLIAQIEKLVNIWFENKQCSLKCRWNFFFLFQVKHISSILGFLSFATFFFVRSSENCERIVCTKMHGHI